jgi:DNA polymerase-1
MAKAIQIAKEDARLTYVVIDGNNLAMRGYYGNIRWNKNLESICFYAITGMMLKLINRTGYVNVRPIIAWDAGGSRLRSGYFEDYKACREIHKETKDAMNEAKKCFGQIAIPQFSCKGVEGDDVLGVVVKTLRDRNPKDRVVIYSADADFYQLLEENGVEQYVPTKNHGFLYTEAMFRKEHDGIKPKDWIKVKALAGDKSDNIPGIYGVGIKRATSIVKKYPKLSDFLADDEYLASLKSLRKFCKRDDKKAELKQMAFRNYVLVFIRLSYKDFQDPSERKAMKELQSEVEILDEANWERDKECIIEVLQRLKIKKFTPQVVMEAYGITTP